MSALFASASHSSFLSGWRFSKLDMYTPVKGDEGLPLRREARLPLVLGSEPTNALTVSAIRQIEIATQKKKKTTFFSSLMAHPLTQAMAAENAPQPSKMDVKSGDAKNKKKVSGKAHAKAAGPGTYFLPPQAQVLQTVQVPRRFPGHFMPHRLCNHWNLQGWCKKAETCTFAHGVEELHPDVQAQLLQQKPGMPPPTVTKDGRLVVHGVTKPAGKVEVPGYPMQPLPNLYEQSTLLGSGLLNTNFAFNLAGPQTVLPLTATTAMASKVAAQEIGEEDGARDRSSSPGTPSKRRPAPAPLTFDDSDETPGTAVPANLTRMSPTVRYTTTTIRAPLASPMRVSLVSRSLPSPVSTGFTPTGMGTSVATSVAMAALSTPKTTVPAAVPSLESPARVTFNRAPGGFWPTSPVSVLPTTPVPIDRSTLLQARQVAVRMEQGPPGLAMWAPTPTTKANLLGFRYPEPGYMSVAPRTPGAA